VGDPRSDIPAGTADALGDAPTQLMAKGGSKALGARDVVHEMTRNFDRVPQTVNAVAQLVIVREVMAQILQPAAAFQDLTAGAQGGAEGEGNPFQATGEEDTRQKAALENKRLKKRWPRANSNIAVEAGDQAHSFPVEGRHYGPQVVRAHAHVGIADHQQVMAGLRESPQEVADLVVRSQVLLHHNPADVLCRELRMQPLQLRKDRVVGVSESKDDFVVRIVQLAEAAEIFQGVRIQARHRLENRYGRPR
jgi:hypothetical protein